MIGRSFAAYNMDTIGFTVLQIDGMPIALSWGITDSQRPTGWRFFVSREWVEVRHFIHRFDNWITWQAQNDGMEVTVHLGYTTTSLPLPPSFRTCSGIQLFESFGVLHRAMPGRSIAPPTTVDSAPIEAFKMPYQPNLKDPPGTLSLR